MLFFSLFLAIMVAFILRRHRSAVELALTVRERFEFPSLPPSVLQQQVEQ